MSNPKAAVRVVVFVLIPNATTPATCLLHFTAVGPGGDPAPGNNSTDVELRVVYGKCIRFILRRQSSGP